METNDIKFLAEVMKKNGITKLDFEDGKTKLSLERSNEQGNYNKATEMVLDAEMNQEDKEDSKNDNFKVIKSPLVGVFYVAKAPGEPAYVEKGSKVSKGNTLCLIEAMKTMNEIPSDIEGTIEEICVSNGQIVEFGQILFKLS